VNQLAATAMQACAPHFHGGIRGRITKWQVYEDTARELSAHAEIAGVA
jgi:hypothetical protein